MKPNRKVVIAGGSGFLGARLSEELIAHEYEVVVLTRSPRAGTGPVGQRRWDGRTAGDWVGELEGAAAVVNLAGRTVNCRYNAANRREIVESRTHSVAAIGEAIRCCGMPPRAWVQAGSLAIYGDTGGDWRDESAPAGEGFSAETCVAWESALAAWAESPARRVVLRIGLALDRGRGALAVLERLVRWGLGGTVGSGRQYLSWIHWRDLNAMFRWAIERDDISGAYNATAPHPAPNAEFMRELRRALHRPWSPPAPVWAVKIGSWLMRTEPSLALTGRRCVPARFLERGFTFAFPELRGALEEVYGG